MTFAHGVHLQPRIRRTESGVLVVRRGLPGLGRLFRFERALFGIASDVLSSQGARFLRGVRRFLRSDDANAIEEAMPQASELWEPSQALFDKIFVAGRNSALEAIQAGAFSPEEWAILRDFLIANEFEYVKGINAKTRQAFPLPPLHPRCRCHVEPVPVEVAE